MTKNYRNEVDEALKTLNLEKKHQLVINTSMGTMTLDLFYDVAPKHCENIMGLARAGFYDGLIFHRVIDGFMIQGGCPEGVGVGGPGFNVNAEFNATPHVEGVLSMARAQDPNSAGSQFFICVADAKFLDKQYTAFGKTVDDESLAVAKSIAKVDKDSRDKPNVDVTIISMTVVEV